MLFHILDSKIVHKDNSKNMYRCISYLWRCISLVTAKTDERTRFIVHIFFIMLLLFFYFSIWH